MTTTQLPSAPPPPPAGFRERALRALETHQGADLVSFLAMVHDQEIAEVVEQAVSARDAVTQVTASAAIDQQMLASVLSTVQPMLRRSGETSARAAHLTSMVESIRKLAADAEAAGTGIDPEQLRRHLDVGPLPRAAGPMVLGFVPAAQYSVGHFRHTVTNVMWYLPFSGYCLVSESERPMTTHVAFLHKGVVRPRPQLFTEYNLVLEHLE